MNIKNYIIVKDNFFDKSTLNLIKKDLLNLKFVNRQRDCNNSNYQSIYFHVPLYDTEHFAKKEVIKKLNFLNIKIKKITSFYFLSTKHKEITAHNDISTLNCLIYLKGKHFVNSGTGFYEKKNKKLELNTHVGFKENRAIIFDSKIYHSSLQFNENCGARYVMANFID